MRRAAAGFTRSPETPRQSKKEAEMSFFDITPESRKLGTALSAWSQARMAADGLDPEAFAMTLLIFDRPLTPATGAGRPAGFAHAGDRAFYPCSVVKVFYLAAAQAQLEAGELIAHGELDRAMRDMIRWSSNMATNYIIDLVTGTTGDTLLGEAELPEWVERRQWVNRYFHSLGWPEAAAANACQKLMDDDRYGREKIFVGMGGNNHNRLSTNAAARLFHEIFAGRIVTPERSRVMAEMLSRPMDDRDFLANPLAQVRGYFAAGLPAGARVWSKAGHTGWTGDADASYRRHDAAYIELPGGRALILAVFTQGRAASESETILPAIAGKAAELLG
jgi:beta-lactamase class A